MPQRTPAGPEHGARRRFALSVSPSGHGAPDLAVHCMRCMHDAACVFPQPRVDSLAIHLSRQVDPGSCARSDGGTRAARMSQLRSGTSGPSSPIPSPRRSRKPCPKVLTRTPLRVRPSNSVPAKRPPTWSSLPQHFVRSVTRPSQRANSDRKVAGAGYLNAHHP